MFSIALLPAVIIVCVATIPVYAGKSHTIVRIYTKGILPYETDLLLPYAIIQKVYQQQLLRQGRHNLGYPLKTTVHAIIRPRSEVKTRYVSYKNPYRQSRKFLSSTGTTSKPSAMDLHFEKDHLNARNFKLYDDDGDHLLNIKYPDNMDGGASSMQPSIANITTTFVKDLPSATAFSIKNNNLLGHVESPKKSVKHVWLNLK